VVVEHDDRVRPWEWRVVVTEEDPGSHVYSQTQLGFLFLQAGAGEAGRGRMAQVRRPLPHRATTRRVEELRVTAWGWGRIEENNVAAFHAIATRPEGSELSLPPPFASARPRRLGGGGLGVGGRHLSVRMSVENTKVTSAARRCRGRRQCALLLLFGFVPFSRVSSELDVLSRN
jgi:hypothetical protein